jgi:hypothetical protein
LLAIARDDETIVFNRRFWSDAADDADTFHANVGTATPLTGH